MISQHFSHFFQPNSEKETAKRKDIRYVFVVTVFLCNSKTCDVHYVQYIRAISQETLKETLFPLSCKWNGALAWIMLRNCNGVIFLTLVIFKLKQESPPAWTYTGYPSWPDLGWGTPPARPGMGYPPARPGMAYPPRPDWGTPPPEMWTDKQT